MKSKRISIKGQFREAYLYFDHLWLVSAEGDIWAFDIDHFLQEVDLASYEVSKSVFSRNDLLQSNNQYISLQSLDGKTQAYLDGGSLEVSQAELEKYSVIFDTKIRARSILDMRCYYHRAYVATENEVLQFEVINRGEMSHLGVGVRANGQLGGARVHDGRCRQFRCKFGAINISCGNDGGFYAAGASAADAGWQARFNRFAEASVATEFVADRVTNIATDLGVRLFSTVTQPAPATSVSARDDEETSEREIVEIGDSDISEDQALGKTIVELSTRNEWTPRRLFLSRKKLYACGPSGQLASIALADQSGILATYAPTRPLPSLPGDILRMTTCSAGLVAELDEASYVYTSGQWQLIFDGPAYTIRGYPTSRWYRNLITAVGDGQTDLIFVV